MLLSNDTGFAGLGLEIDKTNDRRYAVSVAICRSRLSGSVE